MKRERSCRKNGCVGPKALVPRYVEEMEFFLRGLSVLDFGAGKGAPHAERLAEKGVEITAYDLPGNMVDSDLFDPEALSRQYDVVYASNVLNVQESMEDFLHTVEQIVAVTKLGGLVVVNLPNKPRYFNVNADLVEQSFQNFFIQRVRWDGDWKPTKSDSPVFVMRKEVENAK